MTAYLFAGRILSGIIALAGLVWGVYAGRLLLQGRLEAAGNMRGSIFCFTIGIIGLVATSLLPGFIKEQKEKEKERTAAAEAEWQQALDNGYSFYLDGKEVEGKAMNRTEYTVSVKAAEKAVYLTKPDQTPRLVLTLIFGVAFVISIGSLMFRSSSPF